MLKVCPHPLKEQSLRREPGGWGEGWLRCTVEHGILSHHRDAHEGSGIIKTQQQALSPPSFSFLLLLFLLLLVKISHLAEADKMELFIPSMACMSAALGSNSQRDRLHAPVVWSCSTFVPPVHWATASPKYILVAHPHAMFMWSGECDWHESQTQDFHGSGKQN